MKAVKRFVLKCAGGIMLISVIFAGCGNGNDHRHSSEKSGHSHIIGSDEAETIQEIQLFPLTDLSPAYIRLANNVEIIPDIMNSSKTVSVATHEGSFGPLLLGEEIWSFFIDLKPGMFLGEHPHATESLVYTVRGRWVLCSEGKRQVMEAGSIFHFGSNMPTGWEAPFPEGAFLLIVKSKPEGLTYEAEMEALLEVKAMIETERSKGEPFYYFELQEDHPAVTFAREVSPDFDEVLNIKY